MWFEESVWENGRLLSRQLHWPRTLYKLSQQTSDTDRFLTTLNVMQKTVHLWFFAQNPFNLCDNESYAEKCLLNGMHTFHTLPHVRAEDHVIGAGASVFWGMLIHSRSRKTQIITAAVHMVPFFTPVRTCTAKQQLKRHADETMWRFSVVTVGLNPSPLGCLRLWYSTMSLGDSRFFTTVIMLFPVRRFALRMLPLDASVQNTFSCVTQHIRTSVKNKEYNLKKILNLNKLEFMNVLAHVS